MKILSIDTSSKICSVALLEDENIIDEISLDNGLTHSENLMPITSEILNRNNIKLSQIELMVCCVGPGSFTGIRIGVSSCKAMAEVNNLPIVEVTSLEILAKNDSLHKIKVSLIDARNNQVYCGIFDNDYKKVQEYIAGDIFDVINVLKDYEQIVCIGDGAILHKNVILEELSNIDFSKNNEQSAGLGGQVGYQKYLKNEFKNADTIVPMYLRKSQAERNKK